jgi:hypothetical protein
MTVKELCIKLVEMVERGEITGETPVFYEAFDTEERREYLRAKGYNPEYPDDPDADGEQFDELLTEIEVKRAAYTDERGKRVVKIITLS